MPKQGIPGLENFVPSGQLTDPFGSNEESTPVKGRNSTKSRRREYATKGAPKAIAPVITLSQIMEENQKRREQVETEKPFLPSYFIASSTKQFIADRKKKKEYTKEQLATIYDLALIAGKASKRTAPTISDMEVAFEFENMEKLERVAKGEETLQIIRQDRTGALTMSPKQLRMYWQNLASYILKNLRIDSPREVAQKAPEES